VRVEFGSETQIDVEWVDEPIYKGIAKQIVLKALPFDL